MVKGGRRCQGEWPPVGRSVYFLARPAYPRPFQNRKSGGAAMAKSVLLVGLEPTLIDFSEPAYSAFPGLDAQKVRAALEADKATLVGLGYDAELCLIDFGETAMTVVKQKLQEKAYACVMIGAGVRTIGRHFMLFESLINVVHEHAPQAKICFNTKPDDTADAVKRWI